MRLPKPENWTPRTTERVLARIDVLFEQYERCSNVDDDGRELSDKAKALDDEIFHLWDKIPVEDRPKNRPF